MKKGFFASYTGILIGINVIIWLFFLIVSPPTVETIGGATGRVMGSFARNNIALQPSLILSGQKLWTFVTSMFMHSQVLWVHLIFNMISLMFLGGFVEKLIGKKRFLWLYLASGLFAGILFVAVAALTGSGLNLYAVGASGAIFGLGGLLAVLTPRLPVLVFFIIPMPMWIAMVFLIVGLWVLGTGLGLPIGNVAHLGGLIVGVGYGFYLKKKYPRKTKMISSYFAR